MNLYEYQAKEIFAKYDIPIPRGTVVDGKSDLREALEIIGKDKFGMVKSQVLTGGRGKAGGIKPVDTLDQGLDALQGLIGMKIKGLPVERVLVEEKLKIKNEYFISITLDPEESLPVLLISPKGGMDIEEVAGEFPEAIGKYVIKLQAGLPSFAMIELIKNLGFQRQLWGDLINITSKLYKAFCEKEATLIEINPLIETVDGKLIAADGRLNVDDNALFRQPDTSEYKQEFKDMVLKGKGVDYVDLDNGEVGVLCVGAGMTMLTMDLVAQLGSKARCFLDMSHGVNPAGFKAALDLLASEPDIKYVLVNMFGGLTRMDEIARSILEAIDDFKGKFSKPMVLRLQGTNADKGQEIMREAGYTVCSELEDLLDRFKEMLREEK